MPRPTPPSRSDLKASRPTAARMLPGAGTPEAFGPSPHDIGQPVIQRNQGTGDDGEHNGSASISMRFSTPYMDYVREGDLTKFKSIVATMVNTAVAMSKGPYSLKLLAAMGHPYATSPNTEAAVKKLRRSGHNVPRFQPGKAIGHIKGIRGSVATLAVTNIQSGHFADSWNSKVIRDAGGVAAVLSNAAEYAYYLLEGTDKMIAHGPWEYVMKIFLPQLYAEWTSIVTIAWSRIPKAKLKKLALTA